jgi:ribonucleoside-diphosphate reductase alpha chain
MEHYAWTLGLTRMISAVFRRGGDVSFVAEELKAVFDPRGGAWMQGAMCHRCSRRSAR